MASIAYVTAARRSDSVCRETATWAISAKASPASWWSVLSALDTGGLRPGFGWQRKGFTGCGGEQAPWRSALADGSGCVASPEQPRLYQVRLTAWCVCVMTVLLQHWARQ